MIKHRNISALIAAAAFGSTALFGCSSKDDPESVADDQLKLMGTYTEKFTKAAEQAKKDGNAKACQAVLDEFTKAAEKLQEKMDKAFEKLSEEDQEKQQKELQSKMGSKIQEKQSAMDTARKQCFKMGNAEDPEDEEASESRVKEFANVFYQELTKEFTTAFRKLSKQSAVEVEQELQATINGGDWFGKGGKVQDMLKEIGVPLDLKREEIFDLFEEMADDETVQAFEQAQQQYHNAAKAKATLKPAAVVVSTVTKTVPGVGSVTVTQSGVVAPSTRGRGPRHGGNLTTDPSASPPRRPATPPEFAKLPQAQQTAMVNKAAQAISQYANQIKGVSLNGKPKEQQETMLKKAIKDTEPMFTSGPEFIKTKADAAAYQGQPRFVKEKFEQAQEQMREAIADFVKKVVHFTEEEKDAIRKFYQALAEQNADKSEEMTEQFVRAYNKVQGPKSKVTCASIDQAVAQAEQALQNNSLKDIADLLDSEARGEEPSKWPLFVRLSQADQANILFPGEGQSQMDEFQQGLFSFVGQNKAKIEAAQKSCRSRESGSPPPASNSGESGDESVDDEQEELAEFMDYFNAEQATGKPAPAKVAAVKTYLTKVSEADTKLDTALTAIQGSSTAAKPAQAVKAFVDAVTEHSTTLEQLADENGPFANGLSVVFEAGLMPPSEDEEEAGESAEEFLKEFLGGETELKAYKAKRSALGAKLFPAAKIALGPEVAKSSQLWTLTAFKGIQGSTIEELDMMLNSYDAEGQTKRRDLARDGAGDLIPGGKPVAGKPKTKKLAPKRNLSDPN